MRFSILSTAVMALSGTTSAVLTAGDIVAVLNDITAKAESLRQPASALTAGNLVLSAVGLGPVADLVDNIKDTIDTVKIDIADLEAVERSPTKFAGAEAKLVTDAAGNLVNTLTDVLGSVTDKTSVAGDLPGVGGLLKPLLDVVNGLVESLVNTIVGSLLTQVLGLLNDLDIGELTKVIDQLPVGSLTSGLSLPIRA